MKHKQIQIRLLLGLQMMKNTELNRTKYLRENLVDSDQKPRNNLKKHFDNAPYLLARLFVELFSLNDFLLEIITPLWK